MKLGFSRDQKFYIATFLVGLVLCCASVWAWSISEQEAIDLTMVNKRLVNEQLRVRGVGVNEVTEYNALTVIRFYSIEEFASKIDSTGVHQVFLIDNRFLLEDPVDGYSYEFDSSGGLPNFQSVPLIVFLGGFMILLSSVLMLGRSVYEFVW